MSGIQRVVDAVVPDLPSNRKVRESNDNVQWFRINHAQKVMYVPPLRALKTSPILLDKTVEALQCFMYWDERDVKYSWENLNLYEYRGDNIKEGLKKLYELLEDKEYVSCDIETKRIEWEDNYLLSIGFAVDDNTSIAFYDIPINGALGSGYHDEEIFEGLQNFFNRLDIKFIWHNGKFDCGRMKYICNLDCHVDEDTMLLHYARINEKRGTHGLKALGQLYLQSPDWEADLDVLKKKYCKENKIKIKDFTYDLIPIEILIPYMQRDCIATFRLFKLFNDMAKDSTEFIYRKLIEASKAYMEVELAGVYLDIPYLEDVEYQLEKEIDEASIAVDEAVAQVWNPLKYSQDTGSKVSVDEKFNMKSPKQLKWLLKELLGHPVASTDALAIQQLVQEKDNYSPIAAQFLERIGVLRKKSKQMDTYIQGLREAVCRDFRVRGTFNIHGTETGRLSSSNPNMQNIPRDKTIKNLFRASPGYKLVQLDYSQAELRVLAYMSKDPWMIKAYQDGKDFHCAVAEDMFGPDFTKEQRNMAKTINFGIAYGRGPSSIAENFGKTMQESKEIIEKWYAPMPFVKQYIDGQRRKATRGQPCVTIFGRERHFVITDENLYHVQNEYINTPIQSTASDLTMFSLIAIADYIRESGVDARIVTTVHDSIILEVKDNDALIDTIVKKCQFIMSDVPNQLLPDNTVPFRADAEVGYSWGNLKEWEPVEQS